MIQSQGRVTVHTEGITSGIYTAPNTGYMGLSGLQVVAGMLPDQEIRVSMAGLCREQLCNETVVR